MNKFLFSWINTIPFVSKGDRAALKAFIWFVLSCYGYSLQMILFLFLPPLVISKFTISGICVMPVVAIALFANSRMGAISRHRNKLGLVCVGVAYLCLMLIVGLMFNRQDYKSVQTIIVQALFLSAILYVILIGSDGILLTRLVPFLLTSYYVFVVIMLMTRGIHITNVDAAGLSMKIDEFRNTTMVAYQFKTYLDWSLFFVAMACFWNAKLSIWVKILSWLSIVPYLYFCLYLFKFRSSILFVVLLCGLIFCYSLRVLKVRNIVAVVVFMAIGLSWYLGAGAVSVRERINASNDSHDISTHRNTDIFKIIEGERGDEFASLIRSMTGLDWVVGKGFNGSYDATDKFGDSDRAYEWKTCHTGFMMPLLLGGVGYFVFYVSLFIRAMVRKLSRLEMNDGFLIACKIYVIIRFVHHCVDPMPTMIYQFGAEMLVFLCIASLLSPKMPNR